MNMPGFTGEASLYKTGRHYYKAVNLTQTDGVYAALQAAPVFNCVGRHCSLCGGDPEAGTDWCLNFEITDL